MKKSFIALGIAIAAALSFTSCSKEMNDPKADVVSEGVPFEIIASAESSKTTNDGLDTKWAAGDALNIFHVETGATSNFGNNDCFTVKAAEETTFTGNLTSALDQSKSYDWYALYPYVSQLVTPKAPEKGYLPIGSANKSTAQVQNGNDNKDHLAGQYFPLYGKATNVAATTTPSITLNQALAVIKVHVTNTTENSITVSNVKFTAPEAIVGTFYIDFSGETPTFTGSGEGYVSKTAELNVTDGTAIEKDSSADFYIAVKPFTAAADTKLIISVNGYEKELTLTSKVTFPSGTIKKVNFVYDYVEPAFVAGTDVLTAVDFNATTTTYKNFENVVKSTNIKYAGNNANKNGAIQLRSTSNSGIISTTPGGYLQKVTVEWNTETSNGRILDIYGNNTAYTSAANLYESTAQGTKLGTIVYGSSTELNVSGSYQYIGIRSHDGALYLNSISIEWDTTAPKPSCATPTASPASGTPVVGGSTITLSCSTEGSSIYYTVNGETPTISSTLYSSSSPIVINDDTTIKAIAVAEGCRNSSVATFSYSLAKCAAPSSNYASGPVPENAEIELSCSTPGSTIYYTTDESEPTSSSTPYTDAITVTSDVTIKAIAYSPNYKSSDISTFTYTVSTGGEEVTLFKESFGDNSSSARAWDDSYKEQSGILAVYSDASYTLSNVKQGKNTTGKTKSGLNQSQSGTDAIFEVGPLHVSSYSDLKLSYFWKAASVSKTYSTSIYYKTSSAGTYTIVPNSAVGATSFVEVAVDLPNSAISNTLYIKIVFNTSNTQAIIDEVELKGTTN